MNKKFNHEYIEIKVNYLKILNLIKIKLQKVKKEINV